MNESETRAEYIDPKLKSAGWGEVDDSRILREFPITPGKILAGGAHGRAEIADYVLVFAGQKIAVVEAKAEHLGVTEGVAQAKSYAQKLQIEYTYSTNGREIYEINMKTGHESLIDRFPTPSELWTKLHIESSEWQEKFQAVPFENVGGSKLARYYQENAVNNTLSALANGKDRILLTLATGTGKTFISFQIAWKLFQSRWNLSRDGKRRPRILFLADRNILADQAFNSFGAFPEDALVRINPDTIRKKWMVPTNGSIFFTIFQTFMSGKDDTPYFGEYPADFFDLIIIDECHRGGANDEGNWRGILEYFAPAVQLGLTATPKRRDNVDTYKYFGEPVYIYSLKEGINDGFLTPFKVRRVKTTLDDYMYTSDDEIIEGEIEEGKIYDESDFNRIIEIKAREEHRVKVLMDEINQNEKTIVFCASQDHALAVRDLINQHKQSREPNYCARVTASDGAKGEEYLRAFQDNEKTIPTILTTSQKLSTGVDARNVRNIVLLRPVKSMIEFKQIIGRGTRTFDGKDYFTIYDFVDAYQHFADPEWDGEPAEISGEPLSSKVTEWDENDMNIPTSFADEPLERKKRIKIKLRDGKEREIEHMISTSFWGADGKPISSEAFIRNMFDAVLPEFFKSEAELRTIWSDPLTRKVFLSKIAEAGCDGEKLLILQKMIDAEKSDLYDVLAYFSFSLQPLTRIERVAGAKSDIYNELDPKQQEFLDFVLSQYIENGVGTLDESKLGNLILLKYSAYTDAERVFGGVDKIRSTFFRFQKHLYQPQIQNSNRRELTQVL